MEVENKIQSLIIPKISRVHIYLFFIILFYFVFLGLHPWHTEVPRLGVELELELPAYTTATATPDPSCIFSLHLSSQQHGILFFFFFFLFCNCSLKCFYYILVRQFQWVFHFDVGVCCFFLFKLKISGFLV